MAPRHLAGKLRVPAGAALRRAEGSRGVASRSSQLGSGKEGVNVEVPRATSELWSKEELQRMADRGEDMIRRRVNEASSSRPRHELLETLCVSGGALLGLYVGVLMLRYENRTGGKISKWVLGLPTE